MVERTLLIGPFSGIVAEVNGEVGEYEVISGLVSGEKVVITIDREGLGDGVEAIIDTAAKNVEMQ